MLKESLQLCWAQILLYGLLCFNYRAVAQAMYFPAIFSDFLIASLAFFVIKKIAHGADTLHQWVGYTLGSVIGSGLGIYLSTKILGA